MRHIDIAHWAQIGHHPLCLSTTPGNDEKFCLHFFFIERLQLIETHRWFGFALEGIGIGLEVSFPQLPELGQLLGQFFIIGQMFFDQVVLPIVVLFIIVV